MTEHLSSSSPTLLTMNLVTTILQHPLLWTVSQKIFGCDKQKHALYRGAFSGPCTMLDFGCSNGNTFEAFRDFTYYGLDIDPRLIADAQKKFAAENNARFVCADVLEHPFPDEFFDAILFAGTGHHLEDGLFPRIMDALGRMVKIGGSIHFFDVLRSPGEDSALLRLLIHLDQGKFHRTEARYRAMLPTISKTLRPVQMKTMRIRGTLMPQPQYFYAEMKRI